MKIGYFADGVWSHRAIELITKNKKFDIKFIIPRYSSQDPILKKWAAKLNIDYLTIKNINSNEAVKKIKDYEVDIFVSMSFDQIFKKNILSIPILGTINCHAGALPFYRGRNVLNWVLINDEKSFGVTVHYINEGIDTGDIIVQKKELIDDKDDYSTLLTKASKICANLLYEALNLIVKNKIKTIKQSQISIKGSYYRKRVIGDENIKWSWNSRRIFNFVRAISTPGPNARSQIKGNKIYINKVSIIDNIFKNNNLKVGEIIIKNNKNFVKTTDGFLEIESYKASNNYEIKNGDCFDT